MLMMGLFLIKYAVGVALALHPELRRQAAFGLAVPLLYGAFSGVFAARALRMWRLSSAPDGMALRYNGEPS